jgi:hypothetical protein
VLIAPHQRDYIFFAPPGMRAEYALDRATFRELEIDRGSVIHHGEHAFITVEPGTASAITLVTARGDLVRIVTLTRRQALACWKFELWGQERLMLSDATVLHCGDQLQLFSTERETVSLSMYPPVMGGLQTADGPVEQAQDGLFTRFGLQATAVPIPLEITMIAPNKCAIRCPVELLEQLNDIYLRIDYVGDIGEAYIDGSLVADNFCNGTTWEIGLKRFAEQLKQHELLVRITPLYRGGSALRYMSTGMAARLDLSGDSVASIDAVRAVPEYEMIAWPTE